MKQSGYLCVVYGRSKYILEVAWGFTPLAFGVFWNRFQRKRKLRPHNSFRVFQVFVFLTLRGILVSFAGRWKNMFRVAWGFLPLVFGVFWNRFATEKKVAAAKIGATLPTCMISRSTDLTDGPDRLSARLPDRSSDRPTDRPPARTS